MKKNVKKLGALLLAGAMAVSTVGCMPTSKPQESTGEQNAQASDATQGTEEPAAPEELEVDTQTPITLRLNWWGGDSRNQATLAAIDKFQEKYPNIKVAAEYEAFNGHEEKIALGIKSGNAADVMQLDWSWVSTYSPKGDNFYDLNKVSNILDLDNYTEGDKSVFTINGKLNAIPISNTGRVFCWNKTTFDKIGVEIPTTLDELLAAGKAFEAYDDSYYPLVTKELDRAFLMVYYLQCKYGKDWVKDGALQYSQEEIAEGFDFLKNLEDNHVIPTLQKVAGDGADLIDTNANWIDGHYAGIFEWDSSASKFGAALEEGRELVVGDYLTDLGDNKGGYAKVSMCWAINAQTAHPKEAAMLVNYLANNEEAAQILASERGIPVSESALTAANDAGLLNETVVEANGKVLAWVSNSLDPYFEDSQLKGSDGVYYDAMAGLSYGDYTADEAADVLIDGITGVIAQ